MAMITTYNTFNYTVTVPLNPAPIIGFHPSQRKKGTMMAKRTMDKIMTAHVNGANPDPEWVSLIALNPHLACWYAIKALRGRFPEGEAALAKDPDYAYAYAHDALHGRFEAGEPVLSGLYPYAVAYAVNVLRSRFILAERTIAENYRLCRAGQIQGDLYCRNFPEAKAEWAALGWISWFD